AHWLRLVATLGRLCECCGAHPTVPSFPTRRSSDLSAPPPSRSISGWSRAGSGRALVASGRALVGSGRALVGSGRALVGSGRALVDRKSTRLNSSHVKISYAVFCLKKKKTNERHGTN